MPGPPPRRRASSHTCLAGLVGALTALSGLAACESVDTPPSPEPEAPAGIARESWDVRLEMHGSASTITVEAPYIVDLSEREMTRADSGVTVTLSDSTHTPTTRIVADRLLVDHSDDVVSFSGGVEATADGPGVRAQADSVDWDRGTDRLDFAAGAEADLPDGWLRAHRLTGDSDLASWSATGVVSALTSTGDSAQAVHIEARQATVQVIDAHVDAIFDTVRATWQERQLQSLQARYEGGAGRVRLTGAVRLIDGDRQLQASQVEIDLRRSRFAARGDVHVEGDMQVSAEAIDEGADGGWEAWGEPARGRVDGRRLEGRRLHISEATDTVTAAGRVLAEEADRQIVTDSIVVLRDSDEVDAYGDVGVTAADVEGRLQAQRLRSADEGEHLLLWGDASLERQRTTGDALSLRADTLRLDGEEKLLTGVGDFRLASPPGVELRAGRGAYPTAGDSAALTGEVEFVHRTADSISRLRSDSCEVRLEEGEPVGLVWRTPVGGRIDDVEQTSWIDAGSGAATLASGQLRTLVLEDQVEVTHRGESKGRVNQFTARSMEMTFDEDGVLRQVVAEGEAHVRSRLSTGEDEDEDLASTNDVSGQRLEVDLEDGVVRAVRVLESVEGRFQPESSD